MNEALIGEQVTLTSAPSDTLARLVVAAVAGLMEAAGAELADGEALEQQIGEALRPLRSEGGSEVTARLEVEAGGMSVRLYAAGSEEPLASLVCPI